MKNIFQPNHLDRQGATPYVPANSLRTLFLECLPSLNSPIRLKRSRPNKCPSSLPTLMTIRSLEKYVLQLSTSLLLYFIFICDCFQGICLYYMPLVPSLPPSLSLSPCLILHYTATFIGSRCRVYIVSSTVSLL